LRRCGSKLSAYSFLFTVKLPQSYVTLGAILIIAGREVPQNLDFGCSFRIHNLSDSGGVLTCIADVPHVPHESFGLLR
jgi:hypothetical protein